MKRRLAVLFEPLERVGTERDDVFLRVGGKEQQSHVEVLDVSSEPASCEIFTGVQMELLSFAETRPSVALRVGFHNSAVHCRRVRRSSVAKSVGVRVIPVPGDATADRVRGGLQAALSVICEGRLDAGGRLLGREPAQRGRRSWSPCPRGWSSCSAGGISQR